MLERLGIPAWLTGDDARYPGLLIPLYRATGEQISWQYRPDRPGNHPRTGKLRKYVSPKDRPAVLDVHPRNKDRIIDPTVPVWITEGVKKADALTAGGLCAVSVTGVWNWRTQLRTLGDWEDIPLKGRTCFICFDDDARLNPQVALAMARLGAWLRSKGAAEVWYITPPALNGTAPKGADDFLAAGGTIETLVAAASKTPPAAAGPSAEHIGSWADPSPDRPWLWDEWAGDWAAGIDPAEFFDGPAGLAAMRLANAVRSMGPLARGPDGLTWRYRAGVWVPDKNVVQDRCVRLLKNRYRGSHATAAGDVVSALSEAITCEPVEWCINVRNGLLDWRTGQLHPHDPQVPSTVQLGTWWNPYARCPLFDWWLAQVLPPDCIELVWELTGYLAYSGNPLHTAVMLAGSGRNGKGTYLRLAKTLLGEANVTAVSLADLVSTRFTTASLFGKTANIAGDIDGSYLESTAVLKAVTGGDLISAEHKGRDRFDFTPWAVSVFSANKVPASADTTAGYLSRWLVIPFPVSFAGREDRAIEARLHAEVPGILASAVRRLPRLLDRGQFSLGDSAREAKADFERRVDQVRYWLHECCEPTGANTLVNRSELYAAYQRWVLRDGGKPLRASEFYDRLARAGVATGAENGARGFRGIRVIDSAIDAWRIP